MAVDKGLMIRHKGQSPRHLIFELRHAPDQLLVRDHVGNGVIAFGAEILTVHDGQPAHLAEQLIVVAVLTGIFLIDGQPLTQGVWYLHMAAICPERRVVALGGPIRM